ncbi:5866_t:CDS:2 [Diversispora eburnea]|uniref:5866_t:CDS:1 n=1 Tax=Diversispora eburnea TaxID=1213867 RepID=A0A9N8YTB6_9GLOM|nr:5866_t:CDS:2 [Diversispora eburnea]
MDDEFRGDSFFESFESDESNCSDDSRLEMDSTDSDDHSSSSHVESVAYNVNEDKGTFLKFQVTDIIKKDEKQIERLKHKKWISEIISNTEDRERLRPFLLRDLKAILKDTYDQVIGEYVLTMKKHLNLLKVNLR